MDYLFTTRNLRVRKFVPGDAPALFEICAEAKVKKWFPNECFADLEEAEDAVRFYMDCANKNSLPFVLAVELADSGRLIGNTGINRTEMCAEDIEIGYIISEKYAGKGYATELLVAMTEFCISAFGLKSIYGRVIRGNAASARVLEKSGYAFVGEDLDAEDDPYGNGMLVYKKDAVG